MRAAFVKAASRARAAAGGGGLGAVADRVERGHTLVECFAAQALLSGKPIVQGVVVRSRA